jgi:hypothetical protein
MMCLICFLIAVVFQYPNNAREKIVLVSSQDTRNSFYGRWLSLIYTEAFRRLGYDFQYNTYPGARAPIMAENGTVDGEIHRADDYAKITKNLIKVEESPFSVLYGAYAVKLGIILNGWKSLENTDYKVEYRRGSKQPEGILAVIIKPENLSDIATTEQGLKKLITGRTDIYIDTVYVVIENLRRLDSTGFTASKVYLAGIMFKENSYVYMHKKHATLVPKIADVLRVMKKEGLIEQYKKIALEEL